MNGRGSSYQHRMSGFSLVELMVVIAIIGLLSTIVAINVLRVRNTATISKVQADLKMLGDAVSLFRIDNHRLPSSLDELVTTSGAGSQESYLSRGADDLRDPWKRPYQYSLDGADAATPYVIWSYGADGAPGGDRENTDVFSRQR